MAKICIGNGKIVDVQNDKMLGIVVTRNGKVVGKTTKQYEMAVSEFKRVTQENAYAAHEAALRA